MEKIIEKLNELYEKEYQLEEEARESRKQQITLCKKRLLGKCFKIKERHADTSTREEYGRWVYFIRLTIDNQWKNEYYLTAVIIDFSKVDNVQDFGMQISEQSDCTSEWISWLEDAEEATIEEFLEAKSRAYDNIEKLIEQVIEEE